MASVNGACCATGSADSVASVETRQVDCKAECCSKAVLGLLEDLAATDHVLWLWRRLDQHGTQARKDAQPLSTLVREGSVRHMMHLAKLLDVVRSKDIQLCITLFDAFCARCPGGAPLEDIPVIVAAIIILVAKVDGTCKLPWWAGKHLSEEATRITLWLGTVSPNNTPKTVTEDAIRAQERKVLRALGWSVQLPTIESWALLTIDRLNVFSNALYKKSLEWVRDAFLPRYMHLAMLLQPASPELTSGYIAGGMVCLGLFSAQLLPPAILRPAGHSVEHWEQLFRESQPQVWSKPCVLSDDECHNLLEQLAVAIGRDRTDLSTDCGNTLALIRDAMAEARQRAAAQASKPVAKGSV